MPKKEHKVLIATHHERVREAVKHRVRRYQDQLHREIRHQRQALREQFPGRNPPEWIVRHRALLKIRSDEPAVDE
jgi:hypothetical protein